MQKNKFGFTIIELIVVIAIIAILAAIVMVNVTQYIRKAKDAAVIADLKQIQTIALDYYTNPDKGDGSYSGLFEDSQIISMNTSIRNTDSNIGLVLWSSGGVLNENNTYAGTTCPDGHWMAEAVREVPNGDVVVCIDYTGYFGPAQYGQNGQCFCRH